MSLLAHKDPIIKLDPKLNVPKVEMLNLDLFGKNEPFSFFLEEIPSLSPYHFRRIPLPQLETLPFSDISPQEFEELLEWGKQHCGTNNEVRQSKRKGEETENEEVIKTPLQQKIRVEERLEQRPRKITKTSTRKRGLKNVKKKLQF